MAAPDLSAAGAKGETGSEEAAPPRASSDPLFARSVEALPRAVRGRGARIWDDSGRDYIDASGGAIVVGIGHGDESVAAVIAEEVSRLSYTHPTQFDREALHDYAAALAPLLPMEDPRIYPVSGGSDAIEAAMKMARTYHLARGENDRDVLISRLGSYHGNTRGALDASGRQAWRRPYASWLGLSVHVPAVYEYRCPWPTHPTGCGVRHAEALERAILDVGANRVAAFLAEPIGGATLGATVPPEDYWPAVREVCDRHGVLLIADEVMTGFGRTGAWFGLDHWGIRADILATAKGVCSGYWPMGLVCCSGSVYEAVSKVGFIHGGTFSHSGVGAAVALAVLGRLQAGDLVSASRVKGYRLMTHLLLGLQGNRHVGEVRGRGLMVGIEIVADRGTKEPFPRAARVAERATAALKEEGIIAYPSVGCADGERGDVLMLGPPFVITKEELAQVAEAVPEAIERVTAA